jgi:hypothetical protein
LSSDIGNLIDELGRLLAGIQRSIGENTPILVSRKSSSIGLDVTANLSISIGILEPLMGRQIREDEPLVDVLEDGRTVKIVALIPGV